MAEKYCGIIENELINIFWNATIGTAVLTSQTL